MARAVTVLDGARRLAAEAAGGGDPEHEARDVPEDGDGVASHAPTDFFREPDGGRQAPAIERGIVLIGAGGFGREVRQYARDAARAQPGYFVKGFLDDVPPDLEALGVPEPVLGDTDSYAFEENDRALIAIGDPAVRLELAERLERRGVKFVTLVHPLAYVSESATLGTGCIVAPFASIGAHAQMGDHSVLTFYASIGHDARVGRCCGFSPHAVTNGASRLGDGVFLGAYAVVNPRQSVGAGSKVAAGAVVYHAIPSGVLAVGNPAKPRPLWKP